MPAIDPRRARLARACLLDLRGCRTQTEFVAHFPLQKNGGQPFWAPCFEATGIKATDLIEIRQALEKEVLRAAGRLRRPLSSCCPRGKRMQEARRSLCTASASNGLATLHRPTINDFKARFDELQPALLHGTIDEWPALQAWADLDALAERFGELLVPVEVGKSYLEEDFFKSEIPFQIFLDYLQGKIEQDPARPIYLAQHRLFEQIPELAEDIVSPEFCSLGQGDSYGVNAWFGPGGTVSPLHHDPYHNLLAQVVGQKRVRLYSPSETERLYAYQQGVQRNTSQVDVEAPDQQRFPLFDDAPYDEIELQPGDVLFMPRGWWHFCKSQSDVSFSVSHWWL